MLGPHHTSPVLQRSPALKPCTSPKSQRLPTSLGLGALPLPARLSLVQKPPQEAATMLRRFRAGTFLSPAPFSFTEIAAVPQFPCCCDSYPTEDGILQVDPSCSPATQPGWGNCHQGGKGTHMEKAGKHGIPSTLARNEIQLQQKEGGWSPNCPTLTLDLLVLVVCIFISSMRQQPNTLALLSAPVLHARLMHILGISKRKEKINTDSKALVINTANLVILTNNMMQIYL